MRWVALGVDYEMAGKDLINSVKLSGKICAALGGMPPEGFNYELFLDDKGQKISKSKGNGLTIDEWLRYASPESLSLFMYREPKSAKRLYFDVIPRNVDDYQQFLDGFPRQDAKQQLANPVWHIHAGHPPAADMPVTFQLLLTLVSSSNAENAATLWGFIGRYRPGVTPQTHPKLDAMVGYAINYYRDFVAPTKKFREPTDSERAALQDLRDALSQLPAESSAEDIQNVVYEIGRREPFLDAVKKGKDGRPGVSLDWFNMLYQVLLGQEKGPRFGSFVAVYGVAECGGDDRRRAGAVGRSLVPSPLVGEALARGPKGICEAERRLIRDAFETPRHASPTKGDSKTRIANRDGRPAAISANFAGNTLQYRHQERFKPPLRQQHGSLAGRTLMQFRVSPKTLENYSAEEWQARVDLAAAHRLAFNHGFSEGIFNHLTLVVPGSSDRYYQIPFGTHWSEVTASTFMEVGIDDGKVKRGAGDVERSCYCIHAPIHKALPQGKAVFHTHMPYASALTRLEDPRIKEIGQTEVGMMGQIAYDDEYTGPALDPAEGARLPR